MTRHPHRHLIKAHDFSCLPIQPKQPRKCVDRMWMNQLAQSTHSYAQLMMVVLELHAWLILGFCVVFSMETEIGDIEGYLRKKQTKVVFIDGVWHTWATPPGGSDKFQIFHLPLFSVCFGWFVGTGVWPDMSWGGTFGSISSGFELLATRGGLGSVSYTHLTLPTKRIV